MSAMKEIIIQVDEDEYEQIARRAREEGVDLGTYARSALTGDALAIAIPEMDDKQVIRESHDEVDVIPATGSKPTLLENAPALLDGSSIADAVIEDRQ